MRIAAKARRGWSRAAVGHSGTVQIIDSVCSGGEVRRARHVLDLLVHNEVLREGGLDLALLMRVRILLLLLFLLYVDRHWRRDGSSILLLLCLGCLELILVESWGALHASRLHLAVA